MGAKKKLKKEIVRLVMEFVDFDCVGYECTVCALHRNNVCCKLSDAVVKLNDLEGVEE